MDKKNPQPRNTSPRKGNNVSARKGIGNPDNQINMELMDAYVIERIRSELKRRGLALYEDGSVGPDSNISDEYIDWRKTL